jgi:3-oxoacyl-[acyl-carrier protein] reductase
MKNKKLLIIIGGTRGIGESIAKHLSSEYQLALVYKSDDISAQKLTKSLSSITNIKIYKSDACSFELSKKTYEEIKSDFATIPFALIYSAGVSQSSLSIMENTKTHHEIFDVNYFGATYWCKLISNDMCRVKNGKIIAISSIAVAVNTQGLSAYSASKAALEKYICILGGELAPFNITANIIRPGVTSTDMSKNYLENIDENKRKTLLAPTGKTVSTHEISLAASYLLSSNDTNSHILTIDGGHALYRNV